MVDDDGDLQLRFVGDSSDYTTRYKLFWDDKARWFGYKDVTKRRPVAPPPTYSAPKPSYSGGTGYSAPAYDEVEYEDVYYEGS